MITEISNVILLIMGEEEKHLGFGLHYKMAGHPQARRIMQYPRQKFFSALSAGRAVRYFAVAYLGRIYGRQVIGFFSRYYHQSLQVTIPNR